ncbi:MAG: hypothetical protein F4Z08_01985 [Chloroflexi bacterium]|nr:hypothetical protein [Chloroflexota bacterium]
MQHLAAPARAPQPGLDLHRAAGVRRDDRGCAGGRDVGELRVEHLARHGGLHRRVEAGRTAAAVGRRLLAQVDAGNGGEDGARRLADALRVREVAGVLQRHVRFDVSEAALEVP